MAVTTPTVVPAVKWMTRLPGVTVGMAQTWKPFAVGVTVTVVPPWTVTVGAEEMPVTKMQNGTPNTAI